MRPVTPEPEESTHKDPDSALVRECQVAVGDLAIEAFDALFQRYRDRVYNLAFRLLGNGADAEDVSQDAFVMVFRKIGDFRYSSRFYTWLYRVVYNLCVDHLRRQQGLATSTYQEDGSESTLSQIQDPTVGPFEAVAEGEFQRRSVERALQRLSDPLRVVVVLRYMESLQYGEIAQVLDCSVGTVKSRLSRAHAFLQELLRPDLKHDDGAGQG